jgi:DNA repair protein RadD
MTKKTLRYFQQDAIDAIIKDVIAGEVPYINAVTGFGKSIVMADLTERALNKNKRVLQLVPNHTLCTQNYEQTFSYITDKQALGICSAKIGKFQISKKAVIATQTSFLRRRTKSGSFDVLLVDEADMISPDETTTYQKIIKSLRRLNPKMTIVGMTGSPVRKDQGFLHDPVKKGNVIFTKCSYESDIPRLMREGYLSYIEILNTHVSVDLTGVKSTTYDYGKDYNQAECGVKFDKIIDDAVADFKQLFLEKGIKTSLIFASNLANARRIVAAYGNDNECKLAHGDMGEAERKVLIHWLKNGNGNRHLVNVGLYTRGFDFPALEAIVFLRATTSLRLYLQMIGRLLRTHSEKAFGFLADYGSNAERFGPIDALKPPKPPREGECPRKPCLAIIEETIEFEGLTYRKGDECQYPNILSAKKCKCCGAVFISDNETGLYSMKTQAQILAAKQEATTETIEVASVYFESALSKKDGTPMIKIIMYDEFVSLICTDYICINHTGSAKGLATAKIMALLKDKKSFYHIGKFEGGVNVKNMLFLFENYYSEYFRLIKTVTLQQDGRFKKIVSYGL